MNLFDECEADARRGYSYQRDGETDIWLSHYDDVVADRLWSDDCDGLAETVLDLIARRGYPLSLLYRLAVFAPNGEGHMAGAGVDDAGRVWILGDTFGTGPYRAENVRHTPKIYNRLDETWGRDPKTGKPISKWRKGFPWQLVDAKAAHDGQLGEPA
jgi:hypothetical protein